MSSPADSPSVADVMNQDVVFVRSSDSIAQAAAALSRHQISGVPVVNEFGHCVGVISATDYRQHFQEVDGATTPEDHDQTSVADCMTSPAVAIAPDTPLAEAGLVMCSRHVHRLPVVAADGQLAGVISSLDVIASLLADCVETADSV